MCLSGLVSSPRVGCAYLLAGVCREVMLAFVGKMGQQCPWVRLTAAGSILHPCYILCTVCFHYWEVWTDGSLEVSRCSCRISLSIWLVCLFICLFIYIYFVPQSWKLPLNSTKVLLLDQSF